MRYSKSVASPLSCAQQCFSFWEGALGWRQHLSLRNGFYAIFSTVASSQSTPWIYDCYVVVLLCHEFYTAFVLFNGFHTFFVRRSGYYTISLFISGFTSCARLAMARRWTGIVREVGHVKSKLGYLSLCYRGSGNQL